MNPNGRLPGNRAKPGELADAQGGSLVNRIPKPIPWGAFNSFGIGVLHDGKPTIMMLDRQPTDDLEEVCGVILLLLGMMVPKPGPLDWATVPENVRRHFREVMVAGG